MIEGLKPYPKYKDSGLPWLGQVPSGWDIRRLKYLLRELDSRSETGDEQLLRVSQYSGVTIRDRLSDSEQDTRAASLVGYKRVAPDDLTVNIMLAWNGSLGVSNFAGIVSPAYCVYRFKNSMQPQYYHELLRSPVYKDRIKVASRGVVESRLRLYSDDLFRIEALAPPPAERIAIVRFLDHADRKIRRYIAAKRRVIKLLEEEKQEIIHHAVTRGLDPRMRIEHTGNQWFPEIPRGWQVLQLRRVIRQAVDGPHHSPSYLDQGIPFLSARNIRANRWILESAKYISRADYEEFCKRIKPEIGDVLYTKGGTTGVARHVDLDFAFQVWVHVAVLKLRDSILPEYLATALNSPRAYEQAQLLTRGATNQDLGLSRMKGIFIPVPPKSEQQPLLDMITSKRRRIDLTIASTRRELEFISEFSTRLANDVVTGKLDVRTVAASLPDIQRDLPQVEAEYESLAEDEGGFEAEEDAA